MYNGYNKNYYIYIYIIAQDISTIFYFFAVLQFFLIVDVRARFESHVKRTKA